MKFLTKKYLKKTLKRKAETMRATNKMVIEKMENLILNSLCYSDFKRYQKEFSRELDYNIFQYGNLDCYNYDLFMFFKNAGVTEKFVTNYEKELNDVDGVTDKTIDATIHAYKLLVRRAVARLNKKISVGLISENDFVE